MPTCLKNILISVLVGFLVGLALYPFSKLSIFQSLQDQLCFLAGSSIVASLIAYFVLDRFNIDPLIVKTLIRCPMNPLTKARIVILVLLETAAEHEVELTFNVTVEEWIKLLTGAVKLVESKLQMTYTIPVAAWVKFGGLAKEYSDELERRIDIIKHRFVIQPHDVVDATDFSESSLVKDSIKAGVEVRIYSQDKVVEQLVPLQDFALIDDFLAIVGTHPRQNIELRTKVKIKLIAGRTKCGPFSQQIGRLLMFTPETTFSCKEV